MIRIRNFYFLFASLALILDTRAQAQTAYFSLVGDINFGGDQQNFDFDLSRPVDSSEVLRFETFANSGGTNAAGRSIAAGGIDSVIELFDSLDQSRGINDDFFVSREGRDSMLSWSNVPLPGGAGDRVFLNPEPLPAGSYRLNLRAFDSSSLPWAIDLLGPSDAFTLTGETAAGGSTIDTLEFGTTGAGANPAEVTISGETLSVLGDLLVAQRGLGKMTIETGGQVTNRLSLVGFRENSVGVVNVTGTDANGNPSTWTNEFLTIGEDGAATLNVTAGGRVTSIQADVSSGEDGLLPTSTITVSGVGSAGNPSTWNNTSGIDLGDGGGTGILNAEAGGRVTSRWMSVGDGSNGFLNIRGTDAAGNPSTLEVTESLELGSSSSAEGRVRIESGGLLLTGTVSPTWNGESEIGANGIGEVVVTGTDSEGNASKWVNNGRLSIGEGRDGEGSMRIESGGHVSNTSADLGDGRLDDRSRNAMVTVAGTDSSGKPSTWTNDGLLTVGESGNATLDVTAGGYVSSIGALLGESSDSRGIVTVSGTDPNSAPSTWSNNGDLTVGMRGAATLNINSSGVVSITGTTTIGPNGSVNLNGGRFEFGTMSFEDYVAINGVTGALAGSIEGVELVGLNNIANLGAFDATPASIAPEVDVSGVVYQGYVNRGFLYGAGSMDVGLFNDTTGEIQVITGQQMRLLGSATSNAGQVTLAGGQIEFIQGFTNQAGGLVVGDGGLRADGGTTNDGTLAFSSTTRVIGDVINNASGVISSSGGTTTFFDDVTNNGTIRTNSGSFTVYFGSYSGNGDTGTGTVIMEGDLKPGFSPGITSYAGNLQFGDSASLLIELAGLNAGSAYDQVTVAGDLTLDGELVVSLLDGFTPRLNQIFEIATVDGALTGEFDGLGEGDLVGIFGGTELFITYAAGDGNDVALFSAVPEPSGAVISLIALAGSMYLLGNRKSQTTHSQ